MKELKTDPRLIAALKVAAGHSLTAQQRRKQKISFIMGSLDDNSTITRAQVEEQLRQQEGEAA